MGVAGETTIPVPQTRESIDFECSLISGISYFSYAAPLPAHISLPIHPSQVQKNL